MTAPVETARSAVDHAPMQPRDRVECRQYRALLPGRQVGGMLAGEHDPPVERAEILVVLLARLLGPDAKQPSVAGSRCQATEMPFSNSSAYCGWICAPYSTRLAMRSSGVMRGEFVARRTPNA